MGINDTGEQLEAAKAYILELEAQIEALKDEAEEIEAGTKELVAELERRGVIKRIPLTEPAGDDSETFWNLLVEPVAARPTPEECNASEWGHQFTDQCSACGVDAHEWFNGRRDGEL